MSENKRTPEEEENSGFTPSSPVKRTLAWIGLVYALILLALTTYFFFTATGLGNLGPLLTVPGLSAWAQWLWSPGGPPANRGSGPPLPLPPCAGCWPWPPCPSASSACSQISPTPSPCSAS